MSYAFTTNFFFDNLSHDFNTDLDFFKNHVKNREDGVPQEQIDKALANCFETKRPELNCHGHGKNTDSLAVARKIVEAAPEMFSGIQTVILVVCEFFGFDGLYTELTRHWVGQWKYTLADEMRTGSPSLSDEASDDEWDETADLSMRFINELERRGIAIPDAEDLLAAVKTSETQQAYINAHS